MMYQVQSSTPALSSTTPFHCLVGGGFSCYNSGMENIEQVRLLIPDLVKLDDPRDLSAAPEYLFTDDQLQGYLDIEKDNVKRAAARAILAIATTEALILKVITTDDKATDGAKLGAELRAQAKQLRDEAIEDERLVDTTFVYVPFNGIPVDHAWR